MDLLNVAILTSANISSFEAYRPLHLYMPESSSLKSLIKSMIAASPGCSSVYTLYLYEKDAIRF